MGEAKPLSQDQPALPGAPRARSPVLGTLPVVQQALFLPKAELTDGATIDLLPPVGPLVVGQPGGGAEGLAAVEAAQQLLPGVSLLVSGEVGAPAESRRAVWAGEHLAS